MNQKATRIINMWMLWLHQGSGNHPVMTLNGQTVENLRKNARLMRLGALLVCLISVNIGYCEHQCNPGQPPCININIRGDCISPGPSGGFILNTGSENSCCPSTCFTIETWLNISCCDCGTNQPPPDPHGDPTINIGGGGADGATIMSQQNGSFFNASKEVCPTADSGSITITVDWGLCGSKTVTISIPTGGCGDCGGDAATNPNLGDADTQNNSVSVGLGLGRFAFGKRVGRLKIKEQYPTNMLCTPMLLVPRLLYDTNSSAEIITNSYGLRQVKAFETLADVATNGASYVYWVNFFQVTNALMPRSFQSRTFL